MVQTILGTIAIGFFVAATAFAQGQGICTHEDAIQAEKTLDSLSDWCHVYESFKHYSHCDDGAIAEGYSDKIASLLATHWDAAEELFHLWRAHPQFGRFVLAHVDELMSSEQAKNIIRNARERCPPDSKEYCESLEKEAQELMRRGR
jgi:hypothetical protein